MNWTRFRHHLPLLLGLGTIVLHVVASRGPGGAQPSVATFIWLFTVILACAYSASHYADMVAHRLGEPIGTLILTLSVVVIEVSIVAAMMLGGGSEPTVARDTMFSTLMIIMNGLVGMALLAGGINRREQFFNLQSSASYITLIIPLALIALVLPRLTESEPGGYMTPRMEIFVAAASVLMYGAFLWMQTSRYRSFFAHESAEVDAEQVNDIGRVHPDSQQTLHSGGAGHHAALIKPLWRDLAGLVVMLVVVVVLAESLGKSTVGFLRQTGLPPAIAGVLVACLALGPEGLAAIKAARRNSMQRTMNILLGSALSTIGLTVPAVLILARILGQHIELGLPLPEIALLIGTMLISIVNFTHGRANPMQGVVHLALFITYIALLFDVPVLAVE
jgi:Ca2+:H+ antiporter